MRLLFDIESNGLLDTATKVHCIGSVDVDTGQALDWKGSGWNLALQMLDRADTIIGHNILRFDLPLLHKLYGWKPRPEVIIRDTLVCARLKYPNIKELDSHRKGFDRKFFGKHTLGAWGRRLGEDKLDYDGPWDEWSPEMHTYMLQDVQTNLKLWQYLKIDEYSQSAVELEHKCALLCDAIEFEGVPFDEAAARKLHVELVQKKHELETQLKAQFQPWEVVDKIIVPKRDNKRLGYIKGIPVTKKKTVHFNPGSRDHVIKVLTDKGWKPTEFLESGRPDMSDKVIEGLPALYPEMSGLADYLMVTKRLGQLAEGDKSWLGYVKEGKIHGVINPMGTTTSRASHYFPNLAQAPASKSPYGKECRSLFRVPPGWKLVGADMEGLELRGLAHYLAKYDGGKYAETVLAGDPHWKTALAMGLAHGERDKHNPLHNVIREAGSKRFIYAYVYGCGNEKAGTIVYDCLTEARKLGDDGAALYREFFPGKTPDFVKVGKKVRNEFANKIEGLAKLRDKIGEFVEEHGWLPGLDNRRVPTRSQHSGLNFMIQSAGSILCKRWLTDAYEEMGNRYALGWGGEVVPVLYVHDEVQVAVRDGLQDEVGALLVKHARSAGEPYGFRVRLDSKYTVGQSWAETH